MKIFFGVFVTLIVCLAFFVLAAGLHDLLVFDLALPDWVGALAAMVVVAAASAGFVLASDWWMRR